MAKMKHDYLSTKGPRTDGKDDSNNNKRKLLLNRRRIDRIFKRMNKNR